MREPLPHWVTEAMLRLEQNGEEAWLVGGCVRTGCWAVRCMTMT